MFDSLLIANRGEIACRIIKTARRMGLRCVAVYSEADKTARHVELADEAYLIGPAPAAESYLCAERVLDVARRAGVAAIHPGYGFLSENADFAEACAAAGLLFVGPPPAAIRAMGEKDAAKALVSASAVPVVPGYYGEDQSMATLEKEAAGIGYPLLIKAVAGGGGKGMRRVDRAEDFRAALDGARREARAAFGNDRVLLEKYIAKARHIECQIFCDTHGRAVHLFERDCSVQRRHQKVIEEAPAPGLGESLRRKMGAAAIRAARGIEYVGAGTVEFLVDVSAGLQDDAFYFMEMNTRLQVEHPVTEMVTGCDLVEWQLRIAAGEPLPCTQEEISLSGHAVEARLYAEDPENGFLPSTGRLGHVRFPDEGTGLRVETGVRTGDEITIHYDPMIAKVIAWSPTRDGALARLRQGLAAVQIAGVRHNVPFLKQVLAHADFIAGRIDTHFIDTRLAGRPALSTEDNRNALWLAALLFVLDQKRRAELSRPAGDPVSPWFGHHGWRLHGLGTQTLVLCGETSEQAVDVTYLRDGRLGLSCGGRAVTASGALEEGRQWTAQIESVPLRGAVVFHDNRLDLMWQGATWSYSLRKAGYEEEEEQQAGDRVLAPMPGKIITLLVAEGEEVSAGTPLLVMEAMKMEHTLKAPCDGRVDAIDRAVGDQVAEGDRLVQLTAADEADEA